jgi:hypothetical protein
MCSPLIPVGIPPLETVATEVFVLLHVVLDVSLYCVPDEVWTVAVICMEPRAKAKRPLRN